MNTLWGILAILYYQSGDKVSEPGKTKGRQLFDGSACYIVTRHTCIYVQCSDDVLDLNLHAGIRGDVGLR